VKSPLLADKTGEKLLLTLQGDPRASIAELSRQIGLSQTRTAERLRRLEESGVIEGYAVVVNREAIGLPLLAFIRLTCRGERYRPFLGFVEGAQQILECHHLTGGEAFLLKVAVAGMEELEKLIETLLPFGEPTTSLVLSSPVRGRAMKPVEGV
jgi:Lrp/AsnC family leucine-responsive transcriptional regulator